jgi:hypothetical protein
MSERRNIIVQISFLDLHQEYLTHLNYDQKDKVLDSLLRLKYVTEVWYTMNAVVEADLQTSDFMVAKNRTKELEDKIQRLCVRWSKVLGKDN